MGARLSMFVPWMGSVARLDLSPAPVFLSIFLRLEVVRSPEHRGTLTKEKDKDKEVRERADGRKVGARLSTFFPWRGSVARPHLSPAPVFLSIFLQIGRASCREGE